MSKEKVKSFLIEKSVSLIAIAVNGIVKEINKNEIKKEMDAK